MSNTKAAVAAMMKLPKAERLERLVAMSAECVARQEDAAPLLSLIQLELDTPDELEDERAPASRPVSSASTSASGPLAPPPKAKSTRRLLKEKRDELRAMLAKVDGALGNNSGGGSSRQNSRDGASQQSTRPDAVAFAHMSRGEKLQLARQSGYRGGAAAASAQGRSSSAPLVEVPEHIKERFKDEYEADPQAFRLDEDALPDDFSLEERVKMVNFECDKLNGPGMAEIKVLPMHGLLMKFAEACEAGIIIRGLRAVQDFEYEFQMTAMNEQLNPDIETVFLMADVRHQAVASRLVKEIASLGGDITPFLTPDVKRALMEKYGK